MEQAVAVGKPLLTIAELQAQLQLQQQQQQAPAIVMPLLADFWQQYSVATTLKAVMAEAGRGPGSTAPEKPL